MGGVWGTLSPSLSSNKTVSSGGAGWADSVGAESAGEVPALHPAPVSPASSTTPTARGCGNVSRMAQSSAAAAFTAPGSTGMPGPIVVDSVAFLTYRPFAADGLSRMTSSIAAP